MRGTQPPYRGRPEGPLQVAGLNPAAALPKVALRLAAVLWVAAASLRLALYRPARPARPVDSALLADRAHLPHRDQLPRLLHLGRRARPAPPAAVAAAR
jgi:hypothetical protein